MLIITSGNISNATIIPDATIEEESSTRVIVKTHFGNFRKYKSNSGYYIYNEDEDKTYTYSPSGALTWVEEGETDEPI